MPLYDYRCNHCGDFREFRPMRESDVAQPCPTCGAMSERVLSPPFLGGTEPGGGTRVQRYGESGIRHVCGHGCSHSHGH